jgi:hypothetical protein
MLKKDITFKDFNGQTRTESFYFNLKNSDLLKMELSEAGGFADRVNRIISEQNQKKLFKAFEGFVLASYGEKSPDGREHLKSKSITRKFTSTNAYSTLLMELAFDAEAGAEFINGIVTKEQLAEVKEMVVKMQAQAAANNTNPNQAPLVEVGQIRELSLNTTPNVFAQTVKDGFIEPAEPGVGGNPGGSRFLGE